MPRAPLSCDFCRGVPEDFGEWGGALWYFKISADGEVSCSDCRRKLGKGYGRGPWLFIPELMRSRGLNASGSVITDRVLRRERRFTPPEETIQAS